MQDYIDEFDMLYPRVEIQVAQAISFFILGVLPALQMPVRMFKPHSLSEAYSLARLQELTVEAICGTHRSIPTPLFPKTPQHPTSTNITPKKDTNLLLLFTLQ